MPASRTSGPIERIGERGQSLTETVVMLPVVLMLFLGLYYLHDLVHLRLRAIEAARYVTWEATWVPRGNGANPPYKTNGELAKELQARGLGRGLVLVTGRTRPLSQYRSDVSGVAPALFLPGVLTSLMPGGGSSTAAFETIPGDVSSVASPIMNLAGDAHETFAGLANWGDESQKSVYTVRVVYGAESRGFFQPLGGIRVQEFSSILSHPYLIARTDDTREFERLVGSPTEACRDQAHVFGLWFLPSGAAGNSVSSTPGIGGALNAVGGALDLAKCGLGIIGAGGAALDSAIGSDLGFQLPFGTLKEYPELHRVAP